MLSEIMRMQINLFLGMKVRADYMIEKQAIASKRQLLDYAEDTANALAQLITLNQSIIDSKENTNGKEERTDRQQLGGAGADKIGDSAGGEATGREG